MSESTTETEVKLSPVEAIKRGSQWLRGTLVAEMQSGADHFTEEAKNLLKFHGSYQQEDRDARKNRTKAGVGKHYMFMIRLKLPAGKMTAAQYLAMDDICEKYANGTLRFTTRQSIQFHGIVMSNLKNTMKSINDALVTSLGGCGDVNRNVMACPAPTGDQPRVEAVDLAEKVAAHLTPKSKAYHDIWLNGESYSADAFEEDNVEPIYGKVYLPRKFKIGFALPHDNCVDVYTQDLGFLAIIENGRTIGYNVIVGGGMGRTNGKPDTFARLGSTLFFCTPDQVVNSAEQVIKFYRDHGNRGDRKRARIKYVVHDLGVEKVREILAKDYFQAPIAEPKPVQITGVDLHLGWHPQTEGKWFIGLSVENGRIKDEDAVRLRTGVREIVKQFGCEVRITPQQDLLLCNFSSNDRAGVERLMAEHGIAKPENLSLLQKWSMACPAIPTCSLAITESERALPTIIDELEVEMKQLGLDQETVSIRMTGCPNGCARPYASDIGLVGRGGDKYTVYLGGSTLGTRLNYLFQDSVPKGTFVELFRKLLLDFKANRQGTETFGDYTARQGVEKMCDIAGFALPKAV